MKELTGFQRDLLQVVAAGDGIHGLAIKEQLEEYYGKEINHGRLYPNLNKLEEKGLIKKGKKDQRTNSYRLTDEAATILDERRDWEEKQAEELI